MSINKDQLERTLSEYSKLCNGEGDGSYLPEILQESPQESEDDDGTDDIGKYKGNDSFSQFARSHITEQTTLFAIFFIMTHFAREVLHPYISVYLRQLGFNAKQIGYIGCVQPFVGLFYTPFVGYVADKYSINRNIVSVSLVGSALSYMAIYYVPKIRPKDCTDICSYNISSVTVLDHQSDNEYIETTASCQPFTNTVLNIYNTHDLHVVFIYLIFVNIICQILSAPWFPLANGFVLAVLGSERRNEFAFYKGFGGIGHCIGILASGVTLHLTVYTYTLCSVDFQQANFLTCFLMHFVPMCLAAPIAWRMFKDHGDKKTDERKRTYTFSNFVGAILKIRYSSVIIVITWLAIACGKMRTFDFWYINVLGGSYFMIGWGGLISRVCGTIAFFSLPYLSTRIGHIPLLVTACLGIGTACIIAAKIENVTWMVVPLIFKETAVAICTQAQGAFLGNAVENQYQGTLQSIMGSLTFGIGRGVGSLLGGGLIEDISPQMSYHIFSLISFIMAIFLILTQLYIKMVES